MKFMQPARLDSCQLRGRYDSPVVWVLAVLIPGYRVIGTRKQ